MYYPQIKIDQTKSKKLLLCACIFVAMIYSTLLFCPFAYADTGLGNGGFGNDMVNIGRIIQGAGLAFGALGLAWSGVEYSIASGARADKAKSRMIMIGIAVAAIVVLPTVIHMALNLFSSTGWTPA